MHARAIAFLQVHTGLLLFVLSCMHTIFVLMHAQVCSYFVLVLVTRNALVPVLAVISIGATVTWVLAAGFLMGFKFDICALHCLISHVDSPHPHRQQGV